MVPRWQQVFVTDNRVLLLATVFFYWQRWYLTDNRCLLLTTVVPRWQQVFVTDNRGLSLATVFFYWQRWYLTDNRCVSLIDNNGISLTTVFCHWQQCSCKLHQCRYSTDADSYQQLHQPYECPSWNFSSQLVMFCTVSFSGPPFQCYHSTVLEGIPFNP